jgi:hypothetical protein
MDEEISYGNPWNVTYTCASIGYLGSKLLLHNLISPTQASLANEHSVFFSETRDENRMYALVGSMPLYGGHGK